MLKIWLEAEVPHQAIVGIDEAGRGPLAGPCVVVGVILPLNYTHPLINDSKQVSKKNRELAFKDILKDALWINIVTVSPQTIDALNIYQATKQAMIKIAETAPCDVVFTDAMPFKLSNKQVLDFIKGDSRSLNIAAASIVAKVVRDQLMEYYDHTYPLYGFATHKGYPTKAHIEALKRYGVLPIHRLTYGPVHEVSQTTLFSQE